VDEAPVCVESSEAKVLEANWLEALAVWAVVAGAVELAVLDGRFCPAADLPAWPPPSRD
jgi:hypothetical protein